MKETSEFHATCPCGEKIISAKIVTTCPNCGRILDFSNWGKDNCQRKNG